MSERSIFLTREEILIGLLGLVGAAVLFLAVLVTALEEQTCRAYDQQILERLSP